MNIDFTPQEAQFIYENIGQMTVPVTHQNGVLIHSLAQACLRKIKEAAERVEDATPEEE